MQSLTAGKEQTGTGRERPDDWGHIPRLAPDWDPSGRSLSPEEGFLLSRIDGQTPWSQLRQIGGIPPEEVDRCLRRWLGEGVLVVAEAREMAVGPPGDTANASPDVDGLAAELAEAAIEEGIDLSEDLQRRILGFEATLERPYHELLGVARSAGAKEIKRAYFKLSKEYHPDRYYRRQIGGFQPRLERIFKKVVEAYELLSDPTTRAEIERSLGPCAEPEPAPAVPDARSTERSRKREMLERLRRQFRIPEEVLAERKYKARQFFQSAMIAGRRGEWLDAAANVRLAIAFDPWNEEYKAGFSEVQAQVHQVRAAKLLEEASALDAGAHHEALRLYEEALSYRPGDAKIQHTAARVALELSAFDKALEYAEAACELAPEVAAHHVTLGRALRQQGRLDKAVEAFEEALRIEPEAEEANAQLQDLRRRRRRGGGKR